MPPDELREDVRMLKNAVFGNPENPKQTPGVIAELTQMNATLKEVSDSMKRINWTILGAFMTALCALVFKGLLTT